MKKGANSADHLGFKLVMLAPALLQSVTGWESFVPAAFLSLFSVLNIALVWLAARRCGAGEREALWAALAMATANSMFYWSRHLVPYDLALFWALACLCAGLKATSRWWDSLLAGMLGCAAFVTYNGYWAIIVCVLTAHVVWALPSWKSALLRAGWGLVGLTVPFIALLSVMLWWSGIYLLDSYIDFPGSITQGDFGDGAAVVVGYLWSAEGMTALVWAAAFLSLGIFLRRSESGAWRRGVLWAGILTALVLILIVGSDVLDAFVVYGRLVRQAVPFCALLVGWAAAIIWENRSAKRWTERLSAVGWFYVRLGISFLPCAKSSLCLFNQGPRLSPTLGTARIEQFPSARWCQKNSVIYIPGSSRRRLIEHYYRRTPS